MPARITSSSRRVKVQRTPITTTNQCRTNLHRQLAAEERCPLCFRGRIVVDTTRRFVVAVVCVVGFDLKKHAHREVDVLKPRVARQCSKGRKKFLARRQAYFRGIVGLVVCFCHQRVGGGLVEHEVAKSFLLLREQGRHGGRSVGVHLQGTLLRYVADVGVVLAHEFQSPMVLRVPQQLRLVPSVPLEVAKESLRQGQSLLDVREVTGKAALRSTATYIWGTQSRRVSESHPPLEHRGVTVRTRGKNADHVTA